MATRAFLRPSFAPHTFWQLPGNLRVGLCQNACSRAFSSTPRQASTQDNITSIALPVVSEQVSMNLRDGMVSGPLALLDALHGFVPWWAAIPAAAVVLRGFVGYHFGSKQSHKRAQMRVALIPLAAAQRTYLSRETYLKARAGNAPTTFRQRMRLQWRMYYGIDMELRKKFEGQLFRGISAVNLFILLTASEAIRLKTGASDGILSWMAKTLESALRLVVGNPPELPLEGEHAAATTFQPDPASTVVPLDDLVHPTSTTLAATEEHVIYSHNLTASAYDPTTALEGLSFCPDLTMPDPTGYLANTLFLFMVLNVIVRPSRAHTTTWMQWGRSFHAMDYLMFGISYLFWVTGSHIPAGMYLYFISNVVVARLTTIYCHFKRPIPMAVRPCSRVPKI